MKKVLPVLLLLLLASCSFVSETEEKQEKEKYPSIILENADYTLGQSGENPIFIKSALMTFYSEDERATAEALSFVQYDDDGNAAITGNADFADIDTNARSMDLSGNVTLEQHRTNMHIEAETLFFDSVSSEIEADGDVLVSSDDGTFSGTGFKGDLREDIYSFSSIKEGIFNI